MKTLKFREETQQDVFYEDLREQLNKYLKVNNFDGYANWQVWLKAALYGGIYLGLYILLLMGNLSVSSALWTWAGLGFFGILLGLNFSHDAAHDSITPYKRLNKMLYYLTFSALGGNAYLWQLRHVQSHHIFPNVDDCDADIDDNPFIRLSPYKPLLRRHRFQHLYAPIVYLFYTLNWIFIKDFQILRKKRLANLRNIRHPKFEIVFFFAAKIIYVLLMLALPLFFSGLSAGVVLAGFFVMHAVSSYAFVFGLVASHFSDGRAFPKVDDKGFLDQSWSRHQVAVSLDYHATKRWANWIFGGFNAHVAHHLFPTLSHVHYPEISKLIAEMAPKYELPYQNTSWVKAVAAHFRYLKQLGQVAPPPAINLTFTPTLS